MDRVTSLLFALLSVGNARQITSSCTFDSLVASIGNSSAGDVIVFDCPSDDNRIVFENHIFIEHSLTVDGALDGDSVVVLDGDFKWRQFQVAWTDVRWGMQAPNTEVLLTNLRFVNGGGSTVYVKNPAEARNAGGCVYVGLYAALRVVNAHFQNCRTEGTPVPAEGTRFRGGAIATAYDTKYLTLVSSTFCDCFASETGGAVNTVWLNYNTTVVDCVFRGNEAMSKLEAGGGALYLPNTRATIKHSVFAQNRAHMGGAIFSISADLRVENSLFANNSLFYVEGETGNAQARGAAIYSDGTARPGDLQGAEHLWALSDCVFENNEGYASGGAVHICLYDSNSGIGSVNNCNFTGNSVNDVSGDNGNPTNAAAMVYYCTGQLSMSGVLMSGNKVSSQITQWVRYLGTFAAFGQDLDWRLTIVDSEIPGWATTAGNISEAPGPALRAVFDEAEADTLCTLDDDDKSGVRVPQKLAVACAFFLLTFNI